VSRRAGITLIAVLMAVLAAPAAACPSCYGQAGGPVIDGMNNAITAMIGITGFVLTGFIAMFFAIARRARRMRDSIVTHDSTINRQGEIEWKNS